LTCTLASHSFHLPFLFTPTPTSDLYTLSLHDALPISPIACFSSNPIYWKTLSLRRHLPPTFFLILPPLQSFRASYSATGIRNPLAFLIPLVETRRFDSM